MLYTIENEALRVQINSQGCQLWSLRTKDADFEYLWQGDPQFWADRALILFPICCRLWEDRYTYQGKSYDMEIHGFARAQEFTVVSSRADQIALRLESNEQTLSQYPFRFALTVTFTVTGSTVTTRLAVENQDDHTLHFALGGHPGFNVPFAGGDFSDYVLEFDTARPVKALALTQDCYLTDHFVMLPLEDGKILPLRHELFDNDALVLRDMCDTVTLKSRKGGRQIRVQYPRMAYLGLWHAPKTQAPYVCIEPWTGLPAYDGQVDELTTKRDLIALPAGQSDAYAFTITMQ